MPTPSTGGPMQRWMVFSAVLVVAGFAAAQTSRPATAQLTVDIRQRDSADKRAATVTQVREMLKADPAAQLQALTALSGTADIKFDREGLEQAVVELMASPAPGVRRAAVMALPALRPAPSR